MEGTGGNFHIVLFMKIANILALFCDLFEFIIIAETINTVNYRLENSNSIINKYLYLNKYKIINMKLVFLAFTFATARLIISESDELASTNLSRSARDLIGYNRMHNNVQIHRLNTFKNPNFTNGISYKSIDDIPDEAQLSEAESKRWKKLKQRMTAIRRLKRARMLKILGY